MRGTIWLAALLVAALGGPARPAMACATPPVPVYPGGLATGGVDRFGLVTDLGRTFVTTGDPLLWVQQFYYTRLPNDGWAPVTPLPGQHPWVFAGAPFSPNGMPEPVLEFTRANDTQFVRIVNEGSGYTIILSCRD